MVTELPLDAPPLGFHFPLRNRIIAGSARGWWSSKRPGTAARSSRPGWPWKRTARSWPSRATSRPDLSRGDERADPVRSAARRGMGGRGRGPARAAPRRGLSRGGRRRSRRRTSRRRRRRSSGPCPRTPRSMSTSWRSGRISRFRSCLGTLLGLELEGAGRPEPGKEFSEENVSVEIAGHRGIAGQGENHQSLPGFGIHRQGVHGPCPRPSQEQAGRRRRARLRAHLPGHPR